MEQAKKNKLLKIGARAGEWCTAFGVFWFIMLPMMQKSQDERIEKFHALDSSKVSFRSLMSKEFGIDSDRIHIYLKNQDDKIKHLENRLELIFPHLDEEINSITPRLIVKNSAEYWVALDGEYYRVQRNGETGDGFYWFNGDWKQIFK